MVIDLFQGTVITRIGVPSFAVTLARARVRRARVGRLRRRR
jgi:ABC-type xylose transport system permease subunit